MEIIYSGIKFGVALMFIFAGIGIGTAIGVLAIYAVSRIFP